MGRDHRKALIACIFAAITLAIAGWALLRGPEPPDGGRGRELAGGRLGIADPLRTAGSNGEARSPHRESTSLPALPTVEARGDEPRVLVRARWGSGRDELGRSRPEEANPEAPMSFAEAGDGSLVVLDQVQGRLVRFGPDGQPREPIPIAMNAPQDLAIAHDGTIAVLDRLSDERVALLSPEGREIGSLPLEGEGIPESGGVTAVVVDGDDVYVEREHGPLVRLGDIRGNVAPARDEIPGRPTRDGLSYIMAGLIEPAAGRFFVNSIERRTRRHRFTRDIAVPLTLRRILLLDTDRAGIIYVAIAGTPDGAPEEVEEGRLICLAPHDGSTIGVTPLPVSSEPEETLRDLIVLDDGGVLHAMRSAEGVAYVLVDCR